MTTIQREKLPEFAKEILDAIRRRPPKAAGAPDHAFLIFLNGHLGSGKTTFMQAFAKELGITEQIQSPTFVLMKKYLLHKEEKGAPLAQDTAPKGAPFSTLIHIDAYRLEDPKEFATLRPEEFLNDPQNIVCIEWAENIASVLPKPDLVLNFSFRRRRTLLRRAEGMGEGERRIEMQ